MRFVIELTRELVTAFAEATGDSSSLHTDPQFARKTRFRAPIVHGMLPLLLVLNRGVFQEPRDCPVCLAGLTCRFQGPVKIGESVLLEANCLQREGDEEVWALTGSHTGGGAVLEGQARVVRTDQEPSISSISRAALVEEPLVENTYTVSDLSPGLSAELAFMPNPGAFEAVLGEAERQLQETARNPIRDRNHTAVAMLSTLVGMRLPGRYATFLDFDADFTQASEPGPMMIAGRVKEISAARSRITLAVVWRQQGREIGIGSATVMVSPPIGSAISCGEIRSAHLQPGIAGRAALITGASRGIGEASAKLLAMSGARVAVHYFRGEADAARIVEDICANGGSAVAVQADLGEATAIEEMFRSVDSSLGPVDILVNNAVGDFTPVAFDQLRSTDFQHEIDITLYGAHHCCRLALPHMRRQKWGKIVNIGTVATEVPVTSQTKYITAKAALTGYTRALAVETAADNVQVNMVVPAMTETSLVSALPSALLQRLAEEAPSGSLLQPIDVAKVVLFLCSDSARHMSGQRCLLNGGMPPFI